MDVQREIGWELKYFILLQYGAIFVVLPNDKINTKIAQEKNNPP